MCVSDMIAHGLFATPLILSEQQFIVCFRACQNRQGDTLLFTDIYVYDGNKKIAQFGKMSHDQQEVTLYTNYFDF